MAIFSTNFNNPLPKTNIDSDNPCYWIIYKPTPYTINCGDKDVSLEVPIAPEKINHSISTTWWSNNQHLIKAIIPCDQISLDINASGQIPYCVISPLDNTNSSYVKDCVSLYPEAQKLIEFLQNNDCALDNPNHPVLSWFNSIIANNPEIINSSQKFLTSFTKPCDNCNVFCDSCVPFGQYAVTNALLEHNGLEISGSSISVNNEDIDLNDYFNTNLLPIVSYSKQSISNKIFLTNETSDLNFQIPSWLGFNKALIIDDQGNLSSQNVIPGQILQLSDTIILGATTESAPTGASLTVSAPSAPTILSFRISDGELGANTVITLAPNPNISNEDIVKSYAFRFNGVAIRPKRVGPADAIQDVAQGLSNNEYEFEGLLDGQYVTVASVGSNTIGSYGDSVFLGSGCCYISDGTVFDGIEESCQEYTTDTELSYTWSENSCAPTGSWNVGYIVTDSGLFKDKFFITGCNSGTFDSWLNSYNSGIATNFRRNVDCSILSTGTVYDTLRPIPTGDNINLDVSPSLSLTFDSVLSQGSTKISYTDNMFTFSTDAATSGNIGFVIAKPENFTYGDEILSLSHEGTITSVPFILEGNNIVCSNVFANNTHYNPAESGFLDINYSSQDIKPAVMPRTHTIGIFQFVPAGASATAQFGQHYINLFHTHSDQIYFTDANNKRVDLSRYVSNSYLSPVIYPEPIIVQSLSNDEFSACVAIGPPQGWWDPDARNIENDFTLPLAPNLLEYPCENPFYIRGGYNINDLFTFECGCWIVLMSRQQALDLAIAIATIVLTMARLYKLLSGLLPAILSLDSQISSKNAEKDNLLDIMKRATEAMQRIEGEHPQIPGAFPPDFGWVNHIDKHDDGYDGPRVIIVFPTYDEDGNKITLSWDEWLAKHPFDENLQNLNNIYEDYQAWVNNKELRDGADWNMRGLDKEIAKLVAEVEPLRSEAQGIQAQLAGLAASLALLKSQLDQFMNGPAFTERKTCNPGFDFCAWNALYDVCGGSAEPRAYWEKGYSPDGVRLTMPQGWPSCDCCSDCEACADPPPETGWGEAASSPCQTCPDGYTSYWVQHSVVDPDVFDPSDPCEVSDKVCCPPANTLGAFGYTLEGIGPVTEGGTDKCRYFNISDPTAPVLSTNWEIAKRCCDGECVNYCDDC